MASTNTTPFHAEPIPTGVLDHLAARGREMRACTATTLSARYRDPVIRPSMDSMIFRNDFEKKKPHQRTTPTTPGELRNCTFFYGSGIQRCEIRRSLGINRSAIAGSRVFHSRPVLSLSFSVSSSVPLQLAIAVFATISSHPTARRSSNIDLLFLLLSHCAISTDRSRL